MSNFSRIIIVTIVALLSGCEHNEHRSHENVLKLEVTHPQKQDTHLVQEYVSQIKAIQHIELRALEKGYLEHTFVDEGQRVDKGQPMFKLMPNIYQAELNHALAEADIARIEYENTKSLFERDIISANELAIAKAQLQKAQAEVDLAKTHLNFTDIRAPFTGRMDHLEVRTGSLVDEGELLTTLSDLSTMWVYFNVPEAEYLDYVMSAKERINQSVNLKLANGKIYPLPGIIDAVEADFDNHTGTIEMRASFPNPEQVLRHGQTGKVLLNVPYDDALLIPQKATFQILDQTFVYVVNEDDKLEQRRISIAAELPHLFIVEGGLTESDTILLEGLRRVKDGQHISPQRISADDVFANLSLHAE